MAITNFNPTIWSPAILVNLRKALVYGSLLNRDYEGEIKVAGDTVNITSFGAPAVRSYTKNNDISWDILTDATRALAVDQADYFAFTVDDIDRRQSLPGFVEQATSDAGQALADEVDQYIVDLLVSGATNDLGNKSVTVSAATLYAVFVQMRTKLNRANVPYKGRWVVGTPEITEYLLQDARFINAQASADAGMALHAGALGKIAGFDYLESNNVPETSTTGNIKLVAGHPMAATFADQITETEALRLQDQFGDGIRGLHLYGAKVIRGTALVKANVDLG